MVHSEASLLPANQRTLKFVWPITGESSVERLLKLKSQLKLNTNLVFKNLIVPLELTPKPEHS